MRENAAPTPPARRDTEPRTQTSVRFSLPRALGSSVVARRVCSVCVEASRAGCGVGCGLGRGPSTAGRDARAVSGRHGHTRAERGGPSAETRRLGRPASRDRDAGASSAGTLRRACGVPVRRRPGGASGMIWHLRSPCSLCRSLRSHVRRDVPVSTRGRPVSPHGTARRPRARQAQGCLSSHKTVRGFR